MGVSLKPTQIDATASRHLLPLPVESRKAAEKNRKTEKPKNRKTEKPKNRKPSKTWSANENEKIVKLRDMSPCRIRRFIVSGVFSIILHYVKVKGPNKFVDN